MGNGNYVRICGDCMKPIDVPEGFTTTGAHCRCGGYQPNDGGLDKNNPPGSPIYLYGWLCPFCKKVFAPHVKFHSCPLTPKEKGERVTTDAPG
jgi:hypothetical protein